MRFLEAKSVAAASENKMQPGTRPDQRNPKGRMVILPSHSDKALLAQFTKEATDAGYPKKSATKIAQGRLRHLRAGGDGYSDMPEGTTLVNGRIVRDEDQRDNSPTGETSDEVADD